MSENFDNNERSSWQSASSRRGGKVRKMAQDGENRRSQPTGRRWDDNDRGGSRSGGGRRWDDNDRGGRGQGRRWDNDRGERGFGRDDRRGGQERRWNNDREDRGFGRDDRRGQRRWDDNDRGGSRSGSSRRWDDNDRRGGRDQGRRWDNDRGERGFGRDDRRGGQERRWDNDRRQDRGRPERLSDRDRSVERPERGEREHKEPFIPEEITANDLNRDARRHLLSLNKDNADRVARYLVMAGSLMDSNPSLAYEHAKAAYRRAARIDIVREALGLTAYATEKYGEALRELRTYRRMSGDPSHIYLEADCERGMGRPERALKYLEEADINELSPETQIELALVVSGAYADLGESEKGLALVETLKVEDFGDGLRAPVELVRAERLRELDRGEEADAIEEQWASFWEAEQIEVFDEDGVEDDLDDEDVESEDIDGDDSFDEEDEDRFDTDDRFASEVDRDDRDDVGDDNAFDEDDRDDEWELEAEDDSVEDERDFDEGVDDEDVVDDDEASDDLGEDNLYDEDDRFSDLR